MIGSEEKPRSADRRQVRARPVFGAPEPPPRHLTADAFLFDDDGQIREGRYHEEPGKLGYRLRFWTL